MSLSDECRAEQEAEKKARVEEQNRKHRLFVSWISALTAFAALITIALMSVVPWYSRYQARADAENGVYLNNIQIQQTMQLVQVEQQKAQIRIAEAQGIAESQRIINATLTDRYLQHEAIQAQEKMANSPNHTEIYIPSGNNGIPLVKTVDEKGN